MCIELNPLLIIHIYISKSFRHSDWKPSPEHAEFSGLKNHQNLYHGLHFDGAMSCGQRATVSFVYGAHLHRLTPEKWGETSSPSPTTSFTSKDSGGGTLKCKFLLKFSVFHRLSDVKQKKNPQTNQIF
jgi:hypothetical protein